MGTIFALGACGRIDYSPLNGGADGGPVRDAAADARASDGGPVDGRAADAGGPLPLDPTTIVKLTEDAPLFMSPSPTSGDCGQFGMFYVQDDPIDDYDLVPGFFSDPDGHTLWAALPCKPADTGWSLTLGRWDTAGGPFEILDGVAATPEREAFVRVEDHYSDGTLVASTRMAALAFGSDGRVYGTAAVWEEAVSNHHVVPLHADAPLLWNALSYDVTLRGAVDAPVGAVWAMKTALRRLLLPVGSSFYVYSVHWDGTTMSALGREQTSIAVSTSNDMRSLDFGPSPVLVDGWTAPFVSAWGGAYHMVARRLDTNQWCYVRGTSPTSFDFAGAVPLGLARFAGAAGAWDELRYTSHGTSGDPKVVGAIVVAGTLYMFYVAGIPPNGGFAANPGTRGGLGVFTAPLTP